MNQMDGSDHDILISMRTEFRVRLENIENEIKNLKDNTQVTLSDHETRLRGVENWQWKVIGISIGISGMLSIVITIAAAYFGGK